MFLLSEAGSAFGGDERKTHDEIGSRKLGPTQILAVIWRRGNLAFQEIEVALKIRAQEFGFNSTDNGVGNGFYDKRRGALDVCRFLISNADKSYKIRTYSSSPAQ